MYLCICKSITYDIINELREEYPDEYIQMLIDTSGLGTECGACLEEIENERL